MADGIGGSQKLVILQGGRLAVEDALNRLYREYAPIVWAFTPVRDSTEITVVLLHESELRQSAINRIGALTLGGRI